MDLFYIIVLTVAIVVLILVLTYMGLAMRNSTTVGYPGSQEMCPDYWTLTDASNCIIPTSGKNRGININNISVDDTYGLSSDRASINFQDQKWGGTGVSTICAQQKWANKYGIIWDGVTNYNGCK